MEPGQAKVTLLGEQLGLPGGEDHIFAFAGVLVRLEKAREAGFRLLAERNQLRAQLDRLAKRKDDVRNGRTFFKDPEEQVRQIDAQAAPLVQKLKEVDQRGEAVKGQLEALDQEGRAIELRWEAEWLATLTPGANAKAAEAIERFRSAALEAQAGPEFVQRIGQFQSARARMEADLRKARERRDAPMIARIQTAMERLARDAKPLEEEHQKRQTILRTAHEELRNSIAEVLSRPLD